MTSGEDEAEEVISDVIVECSFEIRHGPLLTGLEFASEFTVLLLEQLATAKAVNGAVLGSCHEPGARIVWDTGGGPLLQGGDESVLRELFSKANVAHDARETGDDPGGFDPPDCFDGAMCIGSRHGYRSHHDRSISASRGKETTSSRPRSAPMLWEKSLPAPAPGELRFHPPSPASVSCEAP